MLLKRWALGRSAKVGPVAVACTIQKVPSLSSSDMSFTCCRSFPYSPSAACRSLLPTAADYVTYLKLHTVTFRYLQLTTFLSVICCLPRMDTSPALDCTVLEWLRKKELDQETDAIPEQLESMSNESTIQNYREEGQGELFSRRPRNKIRENRYEPRSQKQREKLKRDARPHKRREAGRVRRRDKRESPPLDLLAPNIGAHRLTVSLSSARYC